MCANVGICETVVGRWLHNGCTDSPKQGLFAQLSVQFSDRKLLIRTPGVWDREIAKPLYGLTPVPRVRIPPSPPRSQDYKEFVP
jgi:hypothetical protein